MAGFLIIAPVRSATAQMNANPGWTALDAQTAFNDFNNAFYFTPDGDDYDYRVQQGMVAPTYFWEAAEELEIAVDAFDHDPTPARQLIITQLCNGFLKRYGSEWGAADSYDDDLMWATIAFVRSYHATLNPQYLSVAEGNFETVWQRGYDTTFGGGIYENVADKPYKSSAANWTFVIAGNLLYRETADSRYLNQAKTIYGWASSHLYNVQTSEVYDGFAANGPNAREFTYNYGVAVGADYFEGNPKDATAKATYLMTNRSLASTTYLGFNIMPVYGVGTVASDGSGFNGIALRWIGYAYLHGAIGNQAVLRWAQMNVGHAWALRNSMGLSWNDWTTQTTHGISLDSWNCGDTVAGMLDIPPSPQAR